MSTVPKSQYDDLQKRHENMRKNKEHEQRRCSKLEGGIERLEAENAALKAKLAQSAQEPVGFVVMERQPLTDEDLDLICEKALFCRISFQQFARSIEAAHGIGDNT